MQSTKSNTNLNKGKNTQYNKSTMRINTENTIQHKEHNTKINHRKQNKKRTNKTIQHTTPARL